MRFASILIRRMMASRMKMVLWTPLFWRKFSSALMAGFCRHTSALLVEGFTSGTFSMSPCKRSESIIRGVRNTKLWPMLSMRITASFVSTFLACSIPIALRSTTVFALRDRLRNAVKLFAVFVLPTAFSSIQQ